MEKSIEAVKNKLNNTIASNSTKKTAKKTINNKSTDNNNNNKNNKINNSKNSLTNINIVIPRKTDSQNNKSNVKTSLAIIPTTQKKDSLNIRSNIKTSLTTIYMPRKMDNHIQYQNTLTHLQSKAHLAAISQKIFTVYGNYPSVRKELTNRGWLERCPASRLTKLSDLPMVTLLANVKPGNDYEIMALSKLMNSYQVKFFWLPKNGKCKSKPFFIPYINTIKRKGNLDFTTKVGLIGCIENSHWNIMDGISEVNVPRYHHLRYNSGQIEFLEDYRTTYCLSLLEYIRSNDISNIFHVCGNIPVETVKYALAKMKLDFMKRESDENEYQNDNSAGIDDFNMDWMSFYCNVNHLVNERDKIKLPDKRIDIIDLVLDSQNVMKQADKYWPQIKSDGYNNLWIIKPAFACRGWGITIKNNFENIVGYIGRRNKIRYIVQKYIERPLLIYNTKFDIRQYILLTITETKFNIWMYKDCYLRFSSQEYKLTNLNEAVHITNNAIQRKYKNGVRSSQLPSENMWSLQEFQKYLYDNGEGDVWQKKIYPGMKKNIRAIVLTSLEETEIYPNLFEIYGCDFMLNEYYEPILIEINSRPDLSSSTIVTAKICPAVLADLIKVVIDLPKNKNAPVGRFELIHSIVYAPTNPMTVSGLEIVGKKCRNRLRK